ncbi:MurT ligase domain-containing protein [Lacticaseibacillus rhamnosus]|uniref:Mur ligase family protein n=1 Tax=Lacticaseibacillus rhamnosus TaxID=47715 RepID=UPI0022E926BF|nr:Mur ligase family protein [Lacticaseibacillus rhamnosus]
MAFSAKASLATAIGRSSYWFLHTFFKGGSSLPGKLANRLDPHVLQALGHNYDVIVVTGTNGKTLTTSLIVKVLKQKYQEVLTNPTGSNMLQGITTAFLAQPKSGHGRGIAVLEVDEANVAPVAAQLKPKAFVLTNIFRDQMDRYGEFYTTYQKILDGITLDPTAVVLANGDAPIFSSRKLPNPIYYYGFTLTNEGDHKAPPNTDGVLCPVCQHILHYHALTYANLGNFFCPNCGFKRPELTYQVNSVTKMTPQSSEFVIDGQPCHIDIGGMYNIYNALAAFAVGRTFDVSPEQISQAFAYDEKVFGRQEVIQLGAKKLTLILVKNPVGLNQVLSMIQTAKQPFGFAMLLNANYADGIDTSWIWDGNFEEFVASKKAADYLVGGERYQDIALRLKVAGVPETKLTIKPDLGDVLTTLQEMPQQQLYVLTTYTAMLQLRKKLSDGGYIKGGF